ncbi:MAG: GNAT family N-acetyltransferase [Bacteroidia bacterium]
MDLVLKRPTTKEFEQIKNYIQQLELDNRNLKQAQFIVATSNKKVVGFGRLLQLTDCMELCSLGVVPLYRRKGIGKKIIGELISQTSQPIYLVSIIPDFFLLFGFKKTENYPTTIQSKLIYCANVLADTEEYVVMRLAD